MTAFRRSVLNGATTPTPDDLFPGPTFPWDRWPVGDPDGREVGTLWTTLWEAPETPSGWRRTIDRADPRVTVSAEFIDRTVGECWWSWWEPDDDKGWTVGSTIVTFGGNDRTVVYRVADWDVKRELWLLEWPD